MLYLTKFSLLKFCQTLSSSDAYIALVLHFLVSKYFPKNDDTQQIFLSFLLVPWSVPAPWFSNKLQSDTHFNTLRDWYLYHHSVRSMSFYRNCLRGGGVNSTWFIQEIISSEKCSVRDMRITAIRFYTEKSSMSNSTQKWRKKKILEIILRIIRGRGNS